VTATRCYCDDCQQVLLETLMAQRILCAIEVQEAALCYGRDDGDFGDDERLDKALAEFEASERGR